jgi:hypothetical protein
MPRWRRYTVACNANAAHNAPGRASAPQLEFRRPFSSSVLPGRRSCASLEILSQAYTYLHEPSSRILSLVLELTSIWINFLKSPILFPLLASPSAVFQSFSRFTEYVFISLLKHHVPLYHNQLMLPKNSFGFSWGTRAANAAPVVQARGRIALVSNANIKSQTLCARLRVKGILRNPPPPSSLSWLRHAQSPGEGERQGEWLRQPV